jgi:sigma-B regulation protein RsbU (phosphoserine phosphatase)
VPKLLLDEARRVIPCDAAVVLLGDEATPADWSAAAELISSVRSTGRPDYSDSALCVPIHVADRLLGVALLARAPDRESFDSGDEKLLLGLASQAGVALERARLYERESRRLQLEQELDVARRIQKSLLPSAPPVVPGWAFAATYEAARQVGGDFYDFLDQSMDEGRLGLVIADVTGKGVPAALMMAHSRAVLRAESMSGASPLDVLRNSNRSFMQERQSRLFLSAFFGEIELGSGRLTYASAGHDAPLLISADGGSVRELDAPGVVLGAFADDGLESRSVTLVHGDTVIMYTDGVTEARDPGRHLYGEERFQESAAVAVASGGSAQTVLGAVLDDVASFTAGAEQADDLTMVVFQRTGG